VLRRESWQNDNGRSFPCSASLLSGVLGLAESPLINGRCAVLFAWLPAIYAALQSKSSSFEEAR
jgi:hypothetical protein